MHQEDHTTKRVLLVEDDDLLRQSLCGFVGALGYEAVPAGSAEEALQRCDGDRVDLVLTDYRLLRMNGLDLILNLRALGVDVPCILISGYLSEDVRQRALDMRGVEVLRKPGDLARLQHLLPDMLGEMV